MRTLLYFIAFLAAGCSLLFDDCIMAQGSFSESRKTGEIADFSLHRGSWAVIDVSKYWKADYGCDHKSYSPHVLNAFSDNDGVRLTSVDQFLIVEGLTDGASQVSVSVRIIYDGDRCMGSWQSEPHVFQVHVGDQSRHNHRSKLPTELRNRVFSVKVDPETFAVGDTVTLTAVTEFPVDVRQSGFSLGWMGAGGTQIVDRSSTMYPECHAETEKRSPVRVVVHGPTATVSGFVRVWSGDSPRHGLGFRVASK